LDAETGLRRRQQGGVEWNRLDAYDLDFHRRVRAGYLALAAAEPERWVVLDATLERDSLQAAVRRAVEQKLAGRSQKSEVGKLTLTSDL
jgi:dTMP kinase